MKLAVTVEHHDHTYVVRRGGHDLYVHLRGGGSRAECRRTAIQRAWQLFVEADRDATEADSVARDARAGGLGLVVLQRALIAVEDLGRLLYAFGGPHPWRRLRHATLRKLDATFRAAAKDPETMLTRFRLTDRHTLDEEHEDLQVIEAIWAAREIAGRRWRNRLVGAAAIWLNYRDVAKATMHGFPVVAGAYAEGPPGAGELGQGLQNPGVRFAVVVTSTVQAVGGGRHVTSSRQVVRLDRVSVDGYRREGRAAARLAGELCEIQAQTINDGYACAIPLDAIRQLGARQQRLIEDALLRRGQIGQGAR